MRSSLNHSDQRLWQNWLSYCGEFPKEIVPNYRQGEKGPSEEIQRLLEEQDIKNIPKDRKEQCLQGLNIASQWRCKNKKEECGELSPNSPFVFSNYVPGIEQRLKGCSQTAVEQIGDYKVDERYIKDLIVRENQGPIQDLRKKLQALTRELAKESQNIEKQHKTWWGKKDQEAIDRDIQRLQERIRNQEEPLLLEIKQLEEPKIDYGQERKRIVNDICEDVKALYTQELDRAKKAVKKCLSKTKSIFNDRKTKKFVDWLNATQTLLNRKPALHLKQNCLGGLESPSIGCKNAWQRTKPVFYTIQPFDTIAELSKLADTLEACTRFDYEI
jgi:hypothetical protein